MSRKIVEPIRIVGQPLISDWFDYRKLPNGLKVINFDEERILEKMETLLELLE